MHADAASTLTGRRARAALGRQKWRFASAPGHTAPTAAARLARRAIRDACRYRPLPSVGSAADRQPNIRRCRNERAKRRRCLAGLDPQVGQRTRFICVFGAHCLALSAVEFFLPCLPEVREDPNIATEPGHGGFPGLLPYVNLSATWYTIFGQGCEWVDRPMPLPTRVTLRLRTGCRRW